MVWDRIVSLTTCPRLEPTGVIVTYGFPVEVEALRVRRVAEQLRSAGLRRIFIAGTSDSVRRLGVEYPARHFSTLTRTQWSSPLIVCPSHQYHIQAHHIAKLLKIAIETRRNVEYQYTDSVFLAHMGLAFRLAVLQPSCKNLAFENFTFGTRKSVFPQPDLSLAVPVDDSDILSAYNAYADTTTPSNFIVELNSTCNFKCFYCPFHGDDTSHPHYVGPGKGAEMQIDDFRDLLAQIAEWKTPYDHAPKTVAPFWSGEFFLAQNWDFALRSIKEFGLRSYVCSNASVLSEEIVDALTGSDYLDHLSISLEADSDDLNRLIRRNKKYDHILSMIDRALERRTRFGRKMTIALNFTMVDSNQHIVSDYVSRWLNKVDYVLLGPRCTLPPGADQPIFDSWPTYLRERIPSIPSRRVPCIYLFHTVSIDCHQNLHLCAPCGSKRITIGNVKGRRIADVQRESPLFQKVVRMQRAGTYLNYPYCASCVMYKNHFSTQTQVFGANVNADAHAWVMRAA
jgi:hypothetical protein